MLSLIFALGSPIGIAQSNDDDAREIAGRVIVVSGNVMARGQNGDRPLRRKEAIYVGDTIFTDIAASTQIRMVDRAIIALHESTEFSIVAYQYEEDVSSDESSIELIQGGFRTITGSIGQQNRDSYEAQIGDFATIGIRGTDFEAVITSNGMFTGVYDGGTTVTNAAGNLDLGVGANFDFAQVATPNSPPVGLLIQPPNLGATAFAADVDDEESSDDEAEDSESSSDSETPDSQDDNDGNPANDGSSDDPGNGGTNNFNDGPSDITQNIANLNSNSTINSQDEDSNSASNLELDTQLTN